RGASPSSSYARSTPSRRHRRLRGQQRRRPRRRPTRQNPRAMSSPESPYVARRGSRRAPRSSPPIRRSRSTHGSSPAADRPQENAPSTSISISAPAESTSVTREAPDPVAFRAGRADPPTHPAPPSAVRHRPATGSYTLREAAHVHIRHDVPGAAPRHQPRRASLDRGSRRHPVDRHTHRHASRGGAVHRRGGRGATRPPPRDRTPPR